MCRPPEARGGVGEAEEVGVSVVVVGLHERDAPLELLEQVSIAERDLPKALQLLCDSPHLSEAAVLSTCMRTEVYAVLDRFHDGLADIHAFFQARLGGSPEHAASLGDRLLVAYDDAAARHLFEVAAGVDSAVLGEGEVLRQVRRAGERARAERAAGPVLGGLFRHAIEVGKRARTETAIARGITSLAHVAVALASERLGGTLAGRRVLVVGAGEMGEAVVSALGASGEGAQVVVANRGRARASALASAIGGRGVELAALGEELAAADLVVSATAADEVVFELDDVRRALERRPGRPLLIIDAAVPRDVDPGVVELEHVELLDVGDLSAYAEDERAARQAEVSHVEVIVDEELERYRTSARGRAVAPLVAQLRARAEEVRVAELERIGPLLERLEPAEREALEALSRRIVAKLLHEPTVQLKLAAGSPKGERLAETLRTLFSL